MISIRQNAGVHAAAAHPANNFDALRLLGAFLVLGSHQSALTGNGELAPWGLYSFGGIGVALFFAISGFLVARSWQADPHVARFAARRLLRIWPAFAVAIAAAALVLGPAMTQLSLHDYFHDKQFRHYLKGLYFNLHDSLPFRFEGNPLPTNVNGSLWTIPVELACYGGLCVAGLVGLFRARYAAPLLWLAIVLVYAAWAPRGPGIVTALGWDAWSRLKFEYVLFFAAGSCYHLLDLGRPGMRWKAVAISLIAGAVAVDASRVLLAYLLVIPVVALSIGLASWPVLHSAGRWGDISFGVYLYAFPVQQTLIWWARGRVHGAVLAAACATVTVVLALLSWHLVEQRALRLKPRAGKGATLAPPAVPDAPGHAA